MIERLWIGQTLTVEPHQLVAFLAGAGYRLPTGTSVRVMPMEHPYQAALQARSTALLTGEPTVAGFGVGAAAFQQTLMGAPYPHPLTAAHEYLTTVRRLLKGEHVDEAGAYVRMHGSLPAVAHPPVEVGAGVLRPGMARIAGAAADAAITFMTPPDYLAEHIVPALTEGAADRPTRPRLVSIVHAAVAAPERDPRHLAHLAAGDHLRAPHYVDMLNRSGLDFDTTTPSEGAAELVRSGVFVYGTPEDVAKRLDEYAAVGVDEIVLNPAGTLLGHGMKAAIADLVEIVRAYTQRPPN
ncbi:oxidoreductase [Streptomyces hygroscopicus subsp. jinggangensis 5008]|nr:oxidoreductase [Streptomyces hygroscopicus subsp. jinggangensis 5008]